MHRIVIGAVLSCLSTTAFAEMARYELDTSHTAVYFTVDHIGYAKTLGIFTGLEGSFTYDAQNRELGEVSVTIDAASVNTFHDGRDNHVRGADFLSVREFPDITFTAIGGEASGANTGTVTGELTILGQTRPVVLAVTLNKVAPYPFGHRREVLGLSLSTEINRSDWGMNYGVANGLVGDAVAINIETEAMKME